MNKFKPGDRVKCLQDSGGGYRKDKIYVVKKVDHEDVYTEFDDNASTTNGWNEDKFVLVSSKTIFNKGDKVRAIAPASAIKVGNIFEITGVGETHGKYGQWLHFNNDLGNKDAWWAMNFVLINTNETVLVNKNKCNCDLYTVLLRYGCACGGT